jgi:hypothetical protein
MLFFPLFLVLGVTVPNIRHRFPWKLCHDDETQKAVLDPRIGLIMLEVVNVFWC